MSRFVFRAIPTDIASAYQDGGPDAHGRPPEAHTGDEAPGPCRHCMTPIQGEAWLVLAHRPFSALQPYAETGPILVHARPCERHPDTSEPPALLLRARQLIVRGYSTDERIVYSTAAVITPDRLTETATTVFDCEDVAFAHVRYAATSCFACRIDRS